jgi:hypothetical protein
MFGEMPVYVPADPYPPILGINRNSIHNDPPKPRYSALFAGYFMISSVGLLLMFRIYMSMNGVRKHRSRTLFANGASPGYGKGASNQDIIREK